MPKYHVNVPEVHYQTVEVHASSPEEAAQLVKDGDGDYLDGALEYSHTLEDCAWMVLDVEKGVAVPVEEE